MRFNSRFLTFFTVFAALLASTTQMRAQGTNRIVVATDQALDLGMVEFLFNPVMNNAGSVAFKANMDVGGQNIQAIFRQTNGQFIELAKAGDLVSNAVQIDDFSNVLQLNDANVTSFVANLLVPGNNDTVLLSHVGGMINELVREGDIVPFGGSFGQLPGPFQAPLLTDNSLNSVIISPQLTNTAFDRGIFRASLGNVFTVARENDPAPNGGTLIHPMRAIIGKLNTLGFLSQVAGGANGVFYFNGNIVQAVSEIGQPSPDGNGTFSSFSVNSQFGLSNPNSSNQIAFLAGLNGTSGGASDNAGVFIGDSVNTAVVARKGDVIPNTGSETLEEFFTPKLNDDGRIAFLATVDNAAAGSEIGIFANDTGQTRQLVRASEVIPGGNGKYGLFNAVGARRIELNQNGVILFQTDLVSTTDDFGIFLTDGLDTVLVAQKGQSLAGSPIVSLLASTSNFGDNGSSFNDRSQVAYRADLANGRSVIARFSPELHWRGAGVGNWFDDENWTLGLRPMAENRVVIDPDTATTVSGPGQELTTIVESLQIGGGLGDVVMDWPIGFELNGGNDITIHDGSTLTGGGLIATETVFVLPGAELLTDQQMFIQTEGIVNESVVHVENSRLTVDGDFVNQAQVNIDPGLGTALVVFGCLNNNGEVSIGFDSAIAVDCLQGHGGGTGLGMLTVTDRLRPGGGQDVASLSFPTVTFELGPEADTDIQIGGTAIGEYDRISVRSAVIDGDLDVELLDGFTLERGMNFSIVGTSFGATGQFNFLPQGALVGTFDGVELRIDYEAGISNSSVSLFAPFDAGDVNQDGLINLLDVQPLVALLTSGNYQFEADVNQDGNVNLLDVQPFIDLLTGN